MENIINQTNASEVDSSIRQEINEQFTNNAQLEENISQIKRLKYPLSLLDKKNKE